MKLNEKGFAVSTILYGILLVGIMVMALLMSTASFNQKTTKDFTETVEKELDATANSFMPTSYSETITGSKTWTAKKTGYYRVEMCSSSACTKGVIYFPVRQKIYFNISGSKAEAKIDKNNSNSSIMTAQSVSNSYLSGHPTGTNNTFSKNENGSNRTDEEITLSYTDRFFLSPSIASGSGTKAVLTYLSDVIDINQKRKSGLTEVRFIRDCTTNSSSKSWAEIEVISNGRNIASGKPVVTDLGTHVGEDTTFLTNNKTSDYKSLTQTSCITVDVGIDMNSGSFYKIDTIGVFHKGSNTSHTIYTSKDGVVFNPVSSGSNINITNGSILSAYNL